MKLLNCICGQKPKLLKRKIALGVDYFYYSCNNCNMETFSTREKSTCKELWNAFLKRKIRIDANLD